MRYIEAENELQEAVFEERMRDQLYGQFNILNYKDVDLDMLEDAIIAKLPTILIK